MSHDRPKAGSAPRAEHVFSRAFVWRSRCAEVIECLWALVEAKPTLFDPQHREHMAALRDELAQLAPEPSTDGAGENDQDAYDEERGDRGLTAGERRAWRVEQIADAALTCVGLEVDEDPNAGPGDGMWLRSYWRIEPAQRGAAQAALGALGTLFEGFVLIAEQP